jgi:hypothetical protein
VLDYEEVSGFYSLIVPVIKAPSLTASLVITNYFTERIVRQSTENISRMLDYISSRVSKHHRIIKHRFIVTQSGNEKLLLDIELNERGDHLQLLFVKEHDKYLIDEVNYA